jgi:hypothetical protein
VKRGELSVGQRFGRLVVLGVARHHQNQWALQCDCGSVATKPYSDLVAGRVKSCGCLKAERRTQAGASSHALYPTWSNMIARCYDEKSVSYQLYGAKGVRVAQPWLNSCAQFISDMGPRPRGASLDRIDPDKDYGPGNCRWASPLEQANNKRNTVRLSTGAAISDYCREHGLNKATVNTRLAHGWSPDEAVGLVYRAPMTAQDKANLRTDIALYEGKTLRQHSRETGIKFHTLRRRVVDLGWPLEKALSTPVRTKST